MISNPRSREKFITVERFLQDDHAMLHIVPSCPGVQIPPNLMEQTTVTLKISRLFRGRLIVSEEAGIDAELLFSNEYFTCKIPFEAVWAATSSSGQMRMWPEDTPEDILASLAAPAREFASDSELAGPETKSSSSKGAKEDKPSTKPRPALRRVK